MKRLLAIVLFALPLYTFGADIARIENPPPKIDLEIINRLWNYVKKETNAPADLPPPVITLDWEIPPFARMGTQYPTVEFPDGRLQISIAPRTVDMMEPEMVQWGIGHEITHYVFILRENGWDASKKVFVVNKKHHCDPEFRGITRGIAQELWNIWHDDAMLAKMVIEEILSCANFPQQ